MSSLLLQAATPLLEPDPISIGGVSLEDTCRPSSRHRTIGACRMHVSRRFADDRSGIGAGPSSKPLLTGSRIIPRRALGATRTDPVGRSFDRIGPPRSDPPRSSGVIGSPHPGPWGPLNIPARAGLARLAVVRRRRFAPPAGRIAVGDDHGSRTGFECRSS